MCGKWREALELCPCQAFGANVDCGGVCGRTATADYHVLVYRIVSASSDLCGLNVNY